MKYIIDQKKEVADASWLCKMFQEASLDINSKQKVLKALLEDFKEKKAALKK